MSSVIIAGNTSGTITLDAPAVAGTTTLTLPATSGTVLASGTAVTVAQGGTGASTLTANNVILGNGTSAVAFVAPSTNGNLLTSNGTTWTSAAAPASGGMTLLGTITMTAVNSVSLTGLTLTSYRALFFGINSIRGSGNQQIYISSTNVQSGARFSGGAGTDIYGCGWIDLNGGGSSGNIGDSGGGVTSTIQFPSSITTASTAVYFRLGSTNSFGAIGSISIYGVK